MQDLKQRLISLAQSLFIDDEAKKQLLQRVEQAGPTPEVIEEVREALDGSIYDYQQSTNKQIAEMEKKMAELETNLNKDFASIEKEIKKEQRKQQDGHQRNTGLNYPQ